MDSPKYPEVSVPLVGQNGNAMAIVGRVSRALQRAGVPKDEQDAFVSEALSGDYDHVLQTCMAWVDAT